MKKMLGLLLALVSSVALAATTVPVQLLNPTGSSSGQAIVSTGSSSAPAWGSVSASAISGVLTVPQGGIGGGSLAQYQPLAGSGTGPVTTLGTGSTGQVLTSNGGSAYPSFQAIPWASPSAIGATTPAAGSFTTLNASGNDALVYDTTNALSLPSASVVTVTTFTKVFDRVNANFNASTGVFTVPATGIYQVCGSFSMASAANVVGSRLLWAVQIGGSTVTGTGNATYETSTGSSKIQVQGCSLVSATSGNSLTVVVTQNTGSTQALDGTSSNWISINRVP